MTNPVTRVKTKPIIGNIFEENAQLNEARYSLNPADDQEPIDITTKKVIFIKKRKVNINIRIENDQDVEIRRIAKLQKVSYADTIRYLLNQGIKIVNK